jgi:hypothetical protein
MVSAKRILVINLGSTSTNVAVHDSGEMLFTDSVSHPGLARSRRERNGCLGSRSDALLQRRRTAFHLLNRKHRE